MAELENIEPIEETKEPQAVTDPALAGPEMIQVNRAQLEALLKKNKDFETMVTKSVEMAILIQNAFGGKFPKSLPDAIGMMPKVWKSFTRNPDFILQLE